MVVDDLDWADAAVETVRGEVASRWEPTDGGLEMTVTVPWNATANVRIPDLGDESVQVTEGTGRSGTGFGRTRSRPGSSRCAGLMTRSSSRSVPESSGSASLLSRGTVASRRSTRH